MSRSCTHVISFLSCSMALADQHCHKDYGDTSASSPSCWQRVLPPADIGFISCTAQWPCAKADQHCLQLRRHISAVVVMTSQKISTADIRFRLASTALQACASASSAQTKETVRVLDSRHGKRSPADIGFRSRSTALRYCGSASSSRTRRTSVVVVVIEKDLPSRHCLHFLLNGLALLRITRRQAIAPPPAPPPAELQP
jgi:hypothetical protein